LGVTTLISAVVGTKNNSSTTKASNGDPRDASKAPTNTAKQTTNFSANARGFDVDLERIYPSDDTESGRYE
jgi:hypothetical protein